MLRSTPTTTTATIRDTLTQIGSLLLDRRLALGALSSGAARVSVVPAMRSCMGLSDTCGRWSSVREIPRSPVLARLTVL